MQGAILMHCPSSCSKNSMIIDRGKLAFNLNTSEQAFVKRQPDTRRNNRLRARHDTGNRSNGKILKLHISSQC